MGKKNILIAFLSFLWIYFGKMLERNVRNFGNKLLSFRFIHYRAKIDLAIGRNIGSSACYKVMKNIIKPILLGGRFERGNARYLTNTITSVYNLIADLEHDLYYLFAEF